MVELRGWSVGFDGGDQVAVSVDVFLGGGALGFVEVVGVDGGLSSISLLNSLTLVVVEVGSGGGVV